MSKLNDVEKAEITARIDAEGFDYYFVDYGADAKLTELIGPKIEAYVRTRAELAAALDELGIEVLS